MNLFVRLNGEISYIEISDKERDSLSDLFGYCMNVVIFDDGVWVAYAMTSVDITGLKGCGDAATMV